MSMFGWSFIVSATQLLTYFRRERHLILFALRFRLAGHDRPLEGSLVGLGWARSFGGHSQHWNGIHN